jgi:RHS repeat-associated protein
VRVLDNGKSVEYDYDHQNRLVRRNDELFVHDGWQIACSLKNGKVAHRYLWGATQDELLAMDDVWALRDHLNTVRKVVDARGCIIFNLEYNAFGALVRSTGDKPLFRYTGKMFDDATSLQWNINRWYDANVGRWVSEDPIGFRGEDKNLCRYVNNMPATVCDQNGLFVCCPFVCWTCTEYSYTRQISVDVVPYGIWGVSVTLNPNIVTPVPLTELQCEEVETYEEEKVCTYFSLFAKWYRTYTRTQRRTLAAWQAVVGPPVFIQGVTLDLVSYGKPIGVGFGYTAVVEVEQARGICNAARP